MRLDLRNHRKIAVIDGRIGYVGSQNIVDCDANRGLLNEELVARVIGPVVHQLQAVLLADRYQETARIGRRSHAVPRAAVGRRMRWRRSCRAGRDTRKATRSKCW